MQIIIITIPKLLIRAESLGLTNNVMRQSEHFLISYKLENKFLNVSENNNYRNICKNKKRHNYLR